MESRNFYNEILTDHNLHPVHKEDIPDANLVLEGLNPSCGDHIWLKLKVEDGIIKDGGFVGDGCAISQASADRGSRETGRKFLKDDQGKRNRGRYGCPGRSRGITGYFPYAGQSKMCCFGMAYHGRTVKRGKIDRMYIYRSY